MFAPLCAKRTRRLIHFFVCTKCKCDRYARFCLAKQMCLQQMCVCGVYLFMWPALCTADAPAVNRALTSRRRRFALVPFSSRLYHYFWLPTIATVCNTRFICLLFPSQGRCILVYIHTLTHTLPLSTQRRFELEILFARLVLYDYFHIRRFVVFLPLRRVSLSCISGRRRVKERVTLAPPSLCSLSL